MVSIFHVLAMAKRARAGDDKMRCEFLLILHLISLPPRLRLPQRPKVLKRLRNEWQRVGRGTRGEREKEKWKKERTEGRKEVYSTLSVGETKWETRRKQEDEGSRLTKVKGHESRPTLTWPCLYLTRRSLLQMRGMERDNKKRQCIFE